MNWFTIQIDLIKPILSFDTSNDEGLREAFNWKNNQALLKQVDQKKELNLFS